MKIRNAELASHPELLNDVLRHGKPLGPQHTKIDDQMFYLLLEKHQPTLSQKTVHYIQSRMGIVKSLVTTGKINVETNTAERRLQICESCIFHADGICLHNACGCNVKPKTILATEVCPAGKW